MFKKEVTVLRSFPIVILLFVLGLFLFTHDRTILAQTSPGQLQSQCENRCTSSNLKGKKLQDCLDRCAKIGDCGPAFQKCTAKAKTEADKQACRDEYRKCKGE